MQTLHECEAYHRTSHANDFGINKPPQRVVATPHKEMSIYPSIRLNDPLRDKVVFNAPRATSPVCTS